MNPPESRRNSSIDVVTGDLMKVIRHHDPEWTDFNESDPGITLLQVEAWLAEQVYSSRTARPTRTDPYRNFNFRVTFEGSTVASVRRVSALRRSVEVIEHREGGDPSSTRRAPCAATAHRRRPRRRRVPLCRRRLPPPIAHGLSG